MKIFTNNNYQIYLSTSFRDSDNDQFDTISYPALYKTINPNSTVKLTFKGQNLDLSAYHIQKCLITCFFATLSYGLVFALYDTNWNLIDLVSAGLGQATSSIIPDVESYVVFDITKFVKSVSGDVKNKSLYMKLVTPNKSLMMFPHPTFGNVDYIDFECQEKGGYHSYLPYYKLDDFLGKNISGLVSLNYGHLLLSVNLTIPNLVNDSFNLSLDYSSSLFGGKEFGGWNLSTYRYYEFNNDTFTIIDSLGTKLKYTKFTERSDLDTLGIVDDFAYYCFEDGSYITFDNTNYHLHYKNKSTLEFNLYANQIIFIKSKSPNGRESTFQYRDVSVNNNNVKQLISITNEDDVITLNYSDNVSNELPKICSITSTKGYISDIAYSNGLIKNISMYRLEFNPANEPNENKVLIQDISLFYNNESKISEIIDKLSGKSCLLEYLDNRLIKILPRVIFNNNSSPLNPVLISYEEMSTTINDTSGEKTYYFNNDGTPSNVVDSSYISSSYSYSLIEDPRDSENCVHLPTNTHRLLAYYRNLINNSINSNDYEIWELSSADVVLDNDIEEIDGKTSIVFTNSSTSNETISQDLGGPHYGTYRLKGYYKTDKNQTLNIEMTYVTTEQIPSHPLNSPHPIYRSTKTTHTSTVSFNLIGDNQWHNLNEENIIIPDESSLILECEIANNSFIKFNSLSLDESSSSNQINYVQNSFFSEEGDINNPIRNWTASDNNHVEVLRTSPLDNVFSINAPSLRFIPSAEPIVSSLTQNVNIVGKRGQTITFSCLVHADLDQNNDFSVQLTIHGIDDKDYMVHAVKEQNSWQLLTTSIVADIDFIQVFITIKRQGYKEALVTCAQLFIDEKCQMYSYDDGGKLVAIDSNGLSQTNSYLNSNLCSSETNLGSNLTYSYNEDGKPIEISDNFGSQVSIDYDDDETSITFTNSEGLSIVTSENNIDGSHNKIDDLGKVTYYCYNEFGQCIMTCLPNASLIRKVYDTSGKIIELERGRYADSSGTISFSYNQNNLVAINLTDDDKYEFSYDEYGRLSHASYNCTHIVSQSYVNGVIIDGCPLLDIKTILSDSYYHTKYTYDESYRLANVYTEDELIGEFSYDVFNRLNKIVNTQNLETITISYSRDKLINSVSSSLGFSYSNYYDNLNKIQHKNVSAINLNESTDFVRNYEINNLSPREFINKVDYVFNDDQVDGGLSLKSRYGAQPYDNLCESTSLEYVFDETLHKKVASIRASGKIIAYNLLEANSTRSKTIAGETFNKSEWDNKFTSTRSAVAWVKFDGLFSGVPILCFYYMPGSAKTCYAYFDTGGTITLKLGNYTQTSQPLGATISDWMMCALIMKQVGNDTIGEFYLNGELLLTLTDSSNNPLYFEYADYLLIGPETSIHPLNTPFGSSIISYTKILHLSFGCYAYSPAEIRSIYNEGYDYLIKPYLIHTYSGVKSSSLSNNDYDYVSLDDNYISNKNISPLVYGETITNDKFDKPNDFLWDNSLKRHVYKSFSNEFSLLGKTSRLVYQFNLFTDFDLKIDFFIPKLFESNQTIVSLSGSSFSSILNVYLYNGNLRININGNVTSTTFNASINTWYSLRLKCLSSTLEIYINDALIDSILFNNSLNHVSIGATANNSSYTAFTDYLNGYLKDFIYCLDFQAISNSSIRAFSNYKEIDSMGRVISTNIGSVTKTFNYITPLDNENNPIQGRTSTKILSETSSIETRTYGYDLNNNVSCITCNNDEIHYEYDYLDRLVSTKLNNQDPTLYEYDVLGNILKVTDSSGDIYDYIYDSHFGHKLLGIKKNNVDYVQLTYTYDESLYPSSIGDLELSWFADKLAAVSVNNETYTYLYDYKNRRIKKQHGNDVINYFYEDNRLLVEKSNEATIIYIYDENDKLIGFRLDKNDSSNYYYYYRDILGIIRKILDSSGQIVASYSYDDFGKLVSINEETSIAGYNHFYYKGYYYDSESGLYYLINRYYSPLLRRFISPDNIYDTIKDKLDSAQFNLFSYCNNNPIMRSDPSGKFSILDVLLIGLTAIVTAVTAVVAMVTDPIGTIALLTQGVSLLSILASNNNSNIIDYFNETASNTVDFIKSFITNFAGNHLYELMVVHDIISNDLLNGNLFNIDNVGLWTCYISPLEYVILSISKSNYEHNVEVWTQNPRLKDTLLTTISGDTTSTAYFNNQAKTDAELLKFGSKNINKAGCTIITLYNALLFCNLPALRHFTAEEDDLLFPNLIAECEKKSLLFGQLGAFPTHIHEMLTKYDEIEVGPIRTSVEDLISDYGEFSMDCAIISTYINGFIPNSTNIPSLTSHTTMIIPISDISNSMFYELNGYMCPNETTKYFSSLSNRWNVDLVNEVGRKFICGFIIKRKSI